MTKPMTRDEIRSKIFSAEAAKPKTKRLLFFGTEVELRQPTIGAILDMQGTEDRKQAIINMMIQYTYVPGTNDPVFELADTETLLAMPWGEDFSRLNEAITELTGVNVEEEEKN